MLPVIWRSHAREELAGIAAYVAEWNELAAEDLVDLIEAATLSLAEFPYRGRVGRQADTRELLAHPNYWIIYRVTLVAVEIVNILHVRREYP